MIYELITLMIGLLFCLFVHELGHALAARFYGVNVLSVSIGFGREVIGFSDRYGTRWLLAGWPLGGACRLLDQSGTNTEERTKDFSNIPKWHQAVIYAAGPLFSIALPALIFVSVGGADLSSIEMMNSKVPYAGLISGLSLFIGLFSLLPIPPLDGGKLLLLAIDGYRKVPLSPAAEGKVVVAGTFILLTATVISTAALFYLVL